MNSPKITIITVVYNGVKELEKTIKSVINQSYKNIEYIIIDGGSNDGTVDLIKNYNSNITYWISEKDLGIYDAMNKGIKQANGDWIYFLNCGDCLIKNETINIIFQNYKQDEADIIYGDIVYVYSFGHYKAIPLPLSQFKNQFPIYHPACFIKACVLKKNLFNLKYRIAADFELLRRLYYSKFIFKYTPEIISIFDSESGISSTRHLQLYSEVLDITEKSKTFFGYLQIIKLYIKIKVGLVIKIFLSNKRLNMIRKKNLEKDIRYSRFNYTNDIV